MNTKEIINELTARKMSEEERDRREKEDERADWGYACGYNRGLEEAIEELEKRTK